MVAITLTDAEIQMGATVGILRRVDSLRRGLEPGRMGAHNWDAEIEGALAECAAANALGKYWSGSVGSFKDADLGKRAQVRATEHDNGKLILRENDKKDHAYILVTGRCPNYIVRGWIEGAEAVKLTQYKTNPGGHGEALFIPQSELKPIPPKVDK